MSRYSVSQYTDGPATQWNVIDRQSQEWVRRFSSEKAAQDYAAQLNERAMKIPYLDKDSSDPSLPMNRTAKPDGPVAWRSRIKGSDSWSVHTEDPTDAISKYATLGLDAYEIEPLYARR